MCQGKNEVISYYRYINIPGQVPVRLVIKIDTEALLLLRLRVGYGGVLKIRVMSLCYAHECFVL